VTRIKQLSSKLLFCSAACFWMCDAASADFCALPATALVGLRIRGTEPLPRILANLTKRRRVGKVDNMPAQLITRFKDVTVDGAILELVIWKVPEPVPPSEHGYKYRAVYVVNGVRVVGFDNERGKGDHCHLDGMEMPYTFTGVDQFIEDFIAAVAARRTP